MSRRSRDYRAEYARRVARGVTRGLSRSQARGHPRPSEKPVRLKGPTFSRQLEVGLRAVQSGKTLAAAARSVHVSPERLRHYLAASGMAERRGRHWVVTGPDKRTRSMLLYSKGEAITVTVNLDNAEQIGAYMASVRAFLESNDPGFLDLFEGQSIVDVAGKKHPFETDPNALYRLADAGAENFEDVYRIVV